MPQISEIPSQWVRSGAWEFGCVKSTWEDVMRADAQTPHGGSLPGSLAVFHKALWRLFLRQQGGSLPHTFPIVIL